MFKQLNKLTKDIKVTEVPYDPTDPAQGKREIFSQGDLKGLTLIVLFSFFVFWVINAFSLGFKVGKMTSIGLGITGFFIALFLGMKLGHKNIVFIFHYLCLKRMYFFKKSKRVDTDSKLSKDRRIEIALRATQKDFSI